MKTNEPIETRKILKENSHLLILWSNAVAMEEGIERDMQERFKIEHKIIIRWSEQCFQKNMSRFYGQKLPDISQKILHCGHGDFILYIISDPQPDRALLNTTSGLQLVNRNIFDAKQLYREMTGGGHKVHATNNQAETLRDGSLLLGPHFPPTLNTSKVLERDLSGAKSWESLEDFFAVMNLCSKYVVLRNYDSLPTYHDATVHGDIDVLCFDRDEFGRLANAQQVFPQNYRRYHMINISGIDIPFDIRDTNEGYFCRNWSQDIIQRRISRNGIYIPCESDHLYSLAYHALLHKKKPSPDYCIKLLKLFEELDNKDPVAFEMGYIASRLRTFIAMNRYKFVRPLDWSVFCNHKHFPEIPFPITRYLVNPPKNLQYISREGRQILEVLLQHKNLKPLRKVIMRMMPKLEQGR